MTLKTGPQLDLLVDKFVFNDTYPARRYQFSRNFHDAFGLLVRFKSWRIEYSEASKSFKVTVKGDDGKAYSHTSIELPLCICMAAIKGKGYKDEHGS